jgi:hypothetical protein
VYSKLHRKISDPFGVGLLNGIGHSERGKTHNVSFLHKAAS